MHHVPFISNFHSTFPFCTLTSVNIQLFRLKLKSLPLMFSFFVLLGFSIVQRFTSMSVDKILFSRSLNWSSNSVTMQLTQLRCNGVKLQVIDGLWRQWLNQLPVIFGQLWMGFRSLKSWLWPSQNSGRGKLASSFAMNRSIYQP